MGSDELFQHFLNYLDEDFLRRREQKRTAGRIRVITAGPNAFIYALGVTTPLAPTLLSTGSRGWPSRSRAVPRGLRAGASATDPLLLHGKLPPPRVRAGALRGRADASLVVQVITA